ncbi:MAG: lysine 5,6-aminomutase subunit alpha [Christensenellales bacterium]
MRLDVMLNDALYGILFRDINMQRTIVDQYFSRVINGYAGVIINTGEDNYLTTDDAIAAAHTVLASQFINEAFAKEAGMREEQMGLGHAFDGSPPWKIPSCLNLPRRRWRAKYSPMRRLNTCRLQSS